MKKDVGLSVRQA